MKIEDALEYAKNELAGEQSSIDARYLLSFLIDKDFTWLKTWPDYLLTEPQLTRFKKLIARRKKGEPIAYITGSKDFWTLTLETNPSTLIPRPETELLVEKALEFLSKNKKKLNNILDLGTGTGAIALAIASERPSDQIVGSDYQAQAVQLALRNVKRNAINNAMMLQSHWFEKFADQKFDLIVSNPPYVEKNDPHLLLGDLVFEPSSALVSGGEGLHDIRLIIGQAKEYLSDNAALMIEHGFQQGEQVRAIFAKNGYREIETHQDLAGLDRVSQGIFSAGSLMGGDQPC